MAAVDHRVEWRLMVMKRVLSSIGNRALQAVIHHPRTDVNVDVIRHGSDYGGWIICPSLLQSDSVVYSLGIGEDVTFDLAMIAEYGVEICAFDPTPKAIEWVEKRDLPKEFRFYPWGVAAFDGEAAFLPPENPDHASYRIESRESEITLLLPVRRLGTIMAELGHVKLDLLKMDIEGAEFEVVNDLLNCRLTVDQLVVEVHPRIGYVFGRSWRLVRSLRRAGFRLFAISDQLCEYSFIHERCGNVFHC